MPTPETLIAHYYRALHNGEMATLRQLMTPESYRMTLEAYGLRLSFADPAFKTLLHRSQDDAAALAEVETAVAASLREAETLPVIAQLRRDSLGTDRKVVHYTEAGVPKKLPFSQTADGWKIDYYAGRRRG